MKPIIVGIDPGTTSAYAILDTQGELIKIKSSRKLDLSTMISEVISYGNPVLVGCDKNPAPTFVEKFSTKAGAKLVYPEQDLKVDEKKELAGVKTKNTHEMDALASAVYALKDYKTLFKKIDEVVEREGKEELRDQLKYVVVKEEISIKKAINYLEEVEEEPEVEDQVKIKVVRPEKELEELEKELALLEQKNEALQEQVKELKKENSKLKKRIKGMPVPQVVKEKESTIRKLGDKLESKKELLQKSKKELEEFKRFITKNSNNALVKKLKNLSRKEYERKKWMDFSRGDILLVEDANVASDEVLDELREKVDVIIYKKKLSVKHSGFTYVNAKNLELEEERDFAFVTKKSLEKELSKKDILKNVVLDYKKKRKV